MAYITIVKGDDTDFLDNQYIVVNFNTDIDLSGFRAVFKLGSVEIEFADLSQKYLEIILSAEFTSTLQKGKMYGTLKLIDTENRIRTVTTAIPFNVITKVLNATQISSQSIQLDVKMDKNEFNIDMNILGLSKTVAQSYLNQMKQSNSQMSEKLQALKILETNVENLYQECSENSQLAEKWATASGLIDGENYSAKYYSNNAERIVNNFQTSVNDINSSISHLDTAKASIDLDNLSQSAQSILDNKLNKQQITNCITEVPQRIKLELNNGTITLKAGSVVIVPNGKNTDGSLRFDEVVIESDITSAFGNGVQKMVFLNPNKTSINNATVSTQTSSGTSNTSTSSYVFWYDTTNNFVKFSSNSGSTWTNGFSLPICLVNGNDNVVTSIDQVFNGFGYIGRHMWFDKGIKCLLGIKRNQDGTIENNEHITKFHIWETHTWTEGRLICINSHGTQTDVMPSRLLKGLKSEMPSEISENALHLYICTDTLEVFSTNTKVANWKPEATIVPVVEYGAVSPSDGTTLTYFKPYQAFRAVDYNEFDNVQQRVYLKVAYQNGVSGYNIWSNGYCEQWGGATGGTNNTGVIITLLKTYKDLNYCLVTSVNAEIETLANAAPLAANCFNKKTSSFNVSTVYGGNGYDYRAYPFSWKACGYLASGQY